MKLGSRLNVVLFNLRDIVSSHSKSAFIEPTEFVYNIRDCFQQFVLPLYPESPAKFLAIRFLLETPESELPVTRASCLRCIELVKQFSYQDRNHFISEISYLINELVIHRHPEWLDPAQGDYEYYYCPTKDEVVLCGQICGALTLNGQLWEGEADLLPATRTVLMRAGVAL
jgi:hypothetical protein